jgi:tellurite methyltransferase
MSASIARWDEKHRAAPDELPPPAGILRELLPLLPPGRALDVACGTGRNAIFLAERGWSVTALDGSRVALEKLRLAAAERGVPADGPSEGDPAPGRSGRIELLARDLERDPLPSGSFDLIVCIRFLQRSLFPWLESSLRPGGMLLVETYTQAQLQLEGGPRNPEYLLERGELREAFPALRTIFYRELRAGQGMASLLAQRRG